MKENSKQTATKTHWKKLHNPNYLGAYSLEPGKDMVLTIKEVKKEVVQNGNSKEECSVCYFQEGVKPMILNVTNSKQIEKLYSTPYIEEWKGKRVQIYAAQVNAFGETVDALRIRPKVPTLNTKEELKPGHKNWDRVKNAIAEGNTTIAAMLKRFEISEVNQEKLLQDEKAEA